MAKTRSGEAADALRSAVDKTYQATVGQAVVTRERAQELVDELTQAAGRVRTVLEDLRVASAEDLRALRRRVSTLERRVAELEGGAARRTGTSGTERSRATDAAARAAKKSPRPAKGSGSRPRTRT